MPGWMDFSIAWVFNKSKTDFNLYFKVVHNHVLILVLYVDDLFLTGDEQLIDQCKRELTQRSWIYALLPWLRSLAKAR